jgi:hypothetical protein
MTLSDSEMRAMLGLSRTYTAVILRAGPAYGSPGSETVVWEHGRRNFELRADGRLAIVCPVADDTELCGIGIFALDPDATDALMKADPGVQAGVFVYDLHPVRGFPGDALP